MRIFYFVNDVADLQPKQTTTLLIAASVRLGFDVNVVGFDSISLRACQHDAVVTGHGVRLPDHLVSASDVTDYVKSKSSASLPLTAKDWVFIRTNPGRDAKRADLHHAFLETMIGLERAGIAFVNSPVLLRYFASKASIGFLPPQMRPKMLVSNQVDEVLSFVRSMDRDCVVKPNLGSRGNNVIRVDPSMPHLATLLQATFNGEAMVAQEFIESDHLGDRRVVVFDGQLIESPKGDLAGIERHPHADDFRANLHAGGTAHPLRLGATAKAAAVEAAQRLAECGVRLAGIDLIGDQIIEFNVFSTGGLFDANRFASFDFCETIIGNLVR